MLYHSMQTDNGPDQEKNLLETLFTKRENAGNQHFLLFSHRVLPFPKQITGFEFTFLFVVCRCFQF